MIGGDFWTTGLGSDITEKNVLKSLVDHILVFDRSESVRPSGNTNSAVDFGWQKLKEKVQLPNSINRKSSVD